MLRYSGQCLTPADPCRPASARGSYGSAEAQRPPYALTAVACAEIQCVAATSMKGSALRNTGWNNGLEVAAKGS